MQGKVYAEAGICKEEDIIIFSFGAGRRPAALRASGAMSFLTEFKDFVNRGNVVDLAVGVVVGGAFGKIVGSLVEDIIMPPVGRICGNLDFSNLYFPLSTARLRRDCRSSRPGSSGPCWHGAIF